MNEAGIKTELVRRSNLKDLKLKLYKFRPLANDKDLDRLKGILETGEFWCSKFSELNDPMEGSFTVPNSCNVSEIIDSIYSQKESYKICSFSDVKALSNPIMWGYYSNGFRGVAIEIEVSSSKVRQIEYVDEVSNLKSLNFDMKAKKILTTKLMPWKHECEYRFLIKTNDNLIKIGQITALYFGDPYWRARNKNNIFAKSPALNKYKELKKKTLESISNLELFSARIENCNVIKSRFCKKIAEIL